MKNLIIFILFLIYTISIFFIDNYVLLAIILGINLVITVVCKINFKSQIKNILKLLPFILFTGLINLIFADLKFAILLSIRLILVCNISYIYSKTISYMEFAELIEKIVYPHKIFKINPKDVSLMVTIALSFIPIMKDEIRQIKNVLNAKGIYPSNTNLIKNASLIFKPFFISILQRTNEIEMSLKAKGYQE